MLKRANVLLQSEFETKTRFSYCWDKQTYGRTFYQKGCHRRIGMYNIKWVTKDSNRLANFTDRYGAVMARVDVEKNESELSVPADQVRWNDYRNLYYKCTDCGHSFRTWGHAVIRYRRLCTRCSVDKYPSAVLGQQRLGFDTVASSRPELLDSLSPDERREFVGSLPLSSSFPAMWTCKSCQEPFKASVRARTGCTVRGQSPIDAEITSMSCFCPVCRFNSLDVKEAKAKLASAKSGKKLSIGSMFTGLDTTLVSRPLQVKQLAYQ